jgi:two-component system nitrate/nitrite response regulator NarL
MTCRVLIVDDHPMIRSAVAMLLDGTDFAIAATADSVESALAAIAGEDPDLVILDLAMPGESGLEVLRRLRAAGDRRPVIVLTAGIDDFSLRDALALAVDGIVLKNNDPAQLLDCLQAVRAGGRWLDPDLAERAAEQETRGPPAPLSARERRLVQLVSRGLRNREIAAELGITEGTVKVYLHALFDKLGVSTRTELAIRSGEDGARF